MSDGTMSGASAGWISLRSLLCVKKCRVICAVYGLGLSIWTINFCWSDRLRPRTKWSHTATRFPSMNSPRWTISLSRELARPGIPQDSKILSAYVPPSQLSYSDNPGYCQEIRSTGDPERIQNKTSSCHRLQCYAIDCAPVPATQPAPSDTNKFQVVREDMENPVSSFQNIANSQQT
jgi:hypothetical protein